MTFGEYKALPGLSHSTIRQLIRGREVVETEKMSFGTRVHNYILEPHVYQHEDCEVKEIAGKMVNRLGLPAFEILKPECAFTCNLVWNGFYLPFKGRVDLSKYEKLVVDLKVIEGATVQNTVNFLGYDTQLTGYGFGFNTNRYLICAYSKKTKKTELITVSPNHEWWKEQIINYGYSL